MTGEGIDAPPPRDDTRDEVGDLARALASMHASLRRQESARRAFVSTASHELRTPLTLLQGMLEMLDEDLSEGRVDLVDAHAQIGGAQKQLRRLEHLASQSTALVPQDVPDKISDSYRLYLSLMYGEKPVITGAFTIEAFNIMKELQLAVRGTRESLAARPLTVFSCCPTAPLKWSDVTSQNVVDCAAHSIPVEFISMPLAGFVAPVTLAGTLVLHNAEVLSTCVLSQLTRKGTPFVYGSSTCSMDLRFGTAVVGNPETALLNAAIAQISRRYLLPCQVAGG